MNVCTSVLLGHSLQLLRVFYDDTCTLPYYRTLPGKDHLPSGKCDIPGSRTGQYLRIAETSYYRTIQMVNMWIIETFLLYGKYCLSRNDNHIPCLMLRINISHVSHSTTPTVHCVPGSPLSPEGGAIPIQGWPR